MQQSKHLVYFPYLPGRPQPAKLIDWQDSNQTDGTRAIPALNHAKINCLMNRPQSRVFSNFA
jgi:hypothetical protein